MYRKGIFFLMMRRAPRSTQSGSSAASDVYKRQDMERPKPSDFEKGCYLLDRYGYGATMVFNEAMRNLSLIHISEPTRPY